MRVTAAQYVIEKLPDWQAYVTKNRNILQAAKKNNSQLLLLPEYAGLELTSWISGDLSEQFEKIQPLLKDYLALFQSLAQEFQLYIQPGTLPVKENQQFKNRAYFFSPQGNVSYQDKLCLTPFERKTNIIAPGNTLKIFETTLGPVGIAICYDSEFPELCHRLAGAGVRILLVPSCTETLHGLTRVAISCRARAIENQFYVVNAYLIGTFPSCDFISENVGQAGIYSPADIGYNADGIVLQGTLNKNELITADIALEKLDETRHNGQTTNFDDLHHCHFTTPTAETFP